MRKIRTAAAIAGACLAACATAAPSRPAAIGVLEGRADAPHRLTVVSAYSCPYCRVFDAQGMAEIRARWMPRGVQLETVPVRISPTDVAATIAATCGQASGYARRSTILYRAQPEILANWNAADATRRAAATRAPDGRGAPEIARLSGLDALAPSLGLDARTLASCLADPARQRRVFARERAADARWRVSGTPTVLLDGRKVGSTWPVVRAALAGAIR